MPMKITLDPENQIRVVDLQLARLRQEGVPHEDTDLALICYNAFAAVPGYKLRQEDFFTDRDAAIEALERLLNRLHELSDPGATD